ncbi:hypothetical protein LTR06_009778 [Exophiala xenobiotica]|nr:hypothetical protein LTR06_009778 [Exophiala xenobiotica]
MSLLCQPSKIKKRKDSTNGNALACIFLRIYARWLPEMQEIEHPLRLAKRRPAEEVRSQPVLSRIPINGGSPYSKAHIKNLLARITQLEAALEAAHAGQNTLSSPPASDDAQSPTELRDTSTQVYTANSHNNLISRLCQRQSQLNSNAEGQYKFFGPTSSLHLTESVSLTILGAWGESSVHEDFWTIDDIDPETQDHLLNLYWDYQHTVLQVLDKTTFLKCLQTRQPKYVSKALLYCIFACAARISPRPAVKALALPRDDDLDEAQPSLIATAARYLEEELKRPRITTIQALLLISVVYCALGRDTKGWLLTGDACRLAIDLEIHKNTTATSVNLSPEDMNVRQITFWGCVVFDRFWALYLGRPYCLKTDNLAAQTINFSNCEDPWEARMAFAWAILLETIGDICEALNGEVCPIEKLEDLDRRLRTWHDHLDASLQYRPDCSPSVAVLHMQYSSALILLHQPAARFGTRLEAPESRSATSRRQCVHHATEIARFLQDYRQKHGDASSLSGVSLHIIATAATTLVAYITEGKPADVSAGMHFLKICVRTLGELETTYFVARRVRKIIQLIIRICHLESDYLASHHSMALASSSQHEVVIGDRSRCNDFMSEQIEANSSLFTEETLSGYSPFAFDEFLPTSAHFDIFHTFDSEALTGQDPFQ